MRAVAVAEEFRRRYQREPDGVFMAPGRVNLIGEHTDYNDGFVLPIAIRHSAVVAVGRRTGAQVTGWSAQLGDGGSVSIDSDEAPTVTGWLSYPAGVVWALREAAGTQGFDLVVDSDVPVGAGLSSSAALECAVALAVADLAGIDVDRMTLAVAAQRAEHDVVGAPVGVMDQAVSLLAEPETALLLDCRSLATRLVSFRPSAAGLSLLVFDTHVRHAHVTGDYTARRRECGRAATALGLASLRDATLEKVDRLDATLRSRVRHVITENARVEAAAEALAADDVAALGPLLQQSHDSLRDDFEVSVTELDTAVAAAAEAGALGARMTGGGFGGCAIALVPWGKEDAVTDGVIRAFAAAGFAPPTVFAAQPSGGARRVDPG